MSKAINRPERQGCTPTSSKCVVWNGKDIPCINLCQGDSIDDVVYKLAEQLCHITDNVLDISKLDVSCLDPVPTTWTATIQALIDSSCGGGGFRGMAPPMMLGATNSNGDIILPEALQYTDENGDLITALPPNDYSAYLAEKIVATINDITVLNSSFGVMNSRMGVIESTLSSVVSVQETQNPIPTIISQCASNTVPGIQTSIDTAFTNFETTYCNMVSVLGSNVDLTNSISVQPSTLNDQSQLSNPTAKMNEIPGWINSPTKISDTISNIWITTLDMRNSVTNYINQVTAIPCILAIPETLVIDSYDTSKVTITWSKSALSGIKDPNGFTMEIYELIDGVPGESPVFSKSYSSTQTSDNIISPYIVADTQYMVKLNCVYSCGVSNFKTVTGILKGVNYIYKVQLSDDIISTILLDCYSKPGDPTSETTSFEYITKRTTVTLFDIATNTESINGFTQPITVKIKYQNNICGILADEEVDIIIPVGVSLATYEYVANNMINCGGEAGCTIATKTPTCGISISNSYILFDNETISDC